MVVPHHWTPAESLAWRPTGQQPNKPQHRGGCACVHLRHLRKTGGQSLVQFFTNLGFERLTPFKAPGKMVSDGAFGEALQLLADDRNFFEQNQAGRLMMVEYHSPWTSHGPKFLKHLQPRVTALRAAYRAANCSFLVLTVVRDPVSHFVSDYYYFGPKARATQQRLQAKDRDSRASGKAAVKTTVARLTLPSVHVVNATLLETARMHTDIQMVHLACANVTNCLRITPGRMKDAAPSMLAERYPYATPSVAVVRNVLHAYDVVGVTEFLGAMQAEICRRLRVTQCPDEVEKNTANPVALLKHTGIGEIDAPLTIDDAKRMTQPGRPIHAVLLALAPLTACVHASALQSWRAGVAACGESVSNGIVSC